MRLANKTQTLILFLSFSLILKIEILFAGWPSPAETPLPLPPQTQEIKQEKRELGAQDLEVSYYQSLLGPEKLKEFYRQRLLKQGWQEKNMALALENLPTMSISSSAKDLSKFFEQNLIFEKDDQMLTLTFLPAGVYQDNQTRFTLSRTKIGDQTGPATEEISFPELLAKPEKNVTPVYPGATLSTLSESANTLEAVYMSKAEIEEVEEFYREKMPDFGWSLVEERPLEKFDLSALSGKGLNESCPSCPQKDIAVNEFLDIFSGELVFANKAGDGCRIVLTSLTSKKEELKKLLNSTTIGVHYVKKE